MNLCARISKTTLGREIIEALRKSQSEEEVAAQQTPGQEVEVDGGSEQKTPTAATHQQPAMNATRKRANPTPKAQQSTASSRNLVDPHVLQIIHDVLDEMFQLIDKCPEIEEPLTFIHKLLVESAS